MARPVRPDRFIVHRIPDGSDVLKCCACPTDAPPAARLGVVWTVSDLMSAIDLHGWKHDVSAKCSVPMNDFMHA